VGDFDGTTAYHIDLVDRRRETPPPGCTLEDLDLNLLLLYKRAPATATPSAEPPRR
jgi:hypothetical protein